MFQVWWDIDYHIFIKGFINKFSFDKLQVFQIRSKIKNNRKQGNKSFANRKGAKRREREEMKKIRCMHQLLVGI